MLRNRSRAVTSKQALTPDHSSQSSPPIQNHTKPVPSFFGSPRFKAFIFTFRSLSETKPIISPTSIIDSTKPISPFKNPFCYFSNRLDKYPKIFSKNKHSWDKLDTEGIGVALIDEKPKEKTHNFVSTSSNRMVLFGTRLRVRIPQFPNFSLSPTESPISQADFGIKTRNSQLSASGSANYGIQTKESHQLLTGCLSMSEMELSEDYTCVISHGPNPRTTHIFDDCVLENFYTLSDDKSNSDPKKFLSICHTCKKNLEQKNDIFIYRGEKAFCSQECRYQEMLIDEMEN